MIKKTHLFILLLAFFSIQGRSQNTGFYWNNLDESSNRLQGKMTGETYYISSLGNSNYFLQKEWLSGIIELEDGDIFKGIEVRYLAYGDELVAYNDKNNSLFIVDKDIVKQFSIIQLSNEGEAKERKFIKLFYDGMNERERYFEELYSGTCSLLAFHHVDAVKVSPYSDRQGIMRDTEYRLNVTYYKYSVNEGFSKMVRKKRAFLKIMPENTKEIRKIFRQNKIVLLDENTMIQAFRVLDEAGLLN